MIGWKVMQYDPQSRRLISGTDKRLSFPAQTGRQIKMPGQGVWLGLDPKYVETHYAVHDHNALLKLNFDPADILHGNLTDREPEFSVPSAKILEIHILQEA